MKKTNYVWMALLTVFSACSDEQTENLPVNVRNYEITATIRSVEPATRIWDADLRNTFETGDEILVGWQDGEKTYPYTYNGENGKFSPKGGANSFWTDLSKVEASTTVDVYSWYGKTADGLLPKPGAAVSALADQSTESAFLSSLYMAAHQRIAIKDA